MMISDAYISERDTIDKLLEALRELPNVDTEEPILEPRASHRDQRIDAKIGFNVAGKRYVLLVEVKTSVYPRDAQQVLWQLSRLLRAESGNERKSNLVPLLAAQSISPGAKDLLKHENFGYFDTGGSLFIPARGAYIYIEKPPPKTLEKSIRGLFRGKRSQVLHTLLVRHDHWFGVKELAEQAQVSPATTSETLTELERFEWIRAQGQGPSKERCLADPGALLNEWQKQIAAAARGLPHRRYYVPGTDAEFLTERLAQLCETHRTEYVLTQEAAAQFYAPFLSTISRVTCRMNSGPAADEVVGELGARVVREGANLDVIETKSNGEFLFKERRNSVWLASPVQVYLDLLRGGGRSKEMAEHLRRERIGF
jgi:hypothetical protein